MADRLEVRFGTVVMVGPFPPPVHGMAAVNEAVRCALLSQGAAPIVLNTAAPTLGRSVMAKLSRTPRALLIVLRLLLLRRAAGLPLYMSVSGGFGQFYEICFAMLARAKRMHVFLHHHTYGYLDRTSALARALFWCAGRRACHVALSQGMSTRLTSLYSIRRTHVLSNSHFIPKSSTVVRQQLRSIGFLSNISAEKGIFEFISLAEAAHEAGLSIKARIAGPFQDLATEAQVLSRIRLTPGIEYVGPKFGEEKLAFYNSIDLLVFPTRYVNEAEPLTIHESMSHRLPVLAYARGAISEIVGAGSGAVFDRDTDFTRQALERISAWVADPESFSAASLRAGEEFDELHSKSHSQWRALLKMLCGRIMDESPSAADLGGLVSPERG